MRYSPHQLACFACKLTLRETIKEGVTNPFDAVSTGVARQDRIVICSCKLVAGKAGHLRNRCQHGEPLADRTIRKFRIVAREAARAVERRVGPMTKFVQASVGSA